MTQTSTPQMTWTEPRRDKYGRPFIYLMATVVKENDTQARWQTCVVLTTLPKTCAPERYMVTNWMQAPFDADGNRKPEPRRYAKRAEAKAAAEALVTERIEQADAEAEADWESRNMIDIDIDRYAE